MGRAAAAGQAADYDSDEEVYATARALDDVAGGGRPLRGLWRRGLAHCSCQRYVLPLSIQMQGPCRCPDSEVALCNAIANAS